MKLPSGCTGGGMWNKELKGKTIVAREPNFDNLLAVLRREVPERPTLFEFFLNERLYKKLAGDSYTDNPDLSCRNRMLIAAFLKAGYDYATVGGSMFSFETGVHDRQSTISLNQNPLIIDRKSFDAYHWRNPDDFDYSSLESVKDDLPPGMKLIVRGPGGVLENAISIVGYDNLCLMLYDDPGLVSDIFENIGTRLVCHYEKSLAYATVGACISNDDWGFKTQTMLSLKDMHKYVFPWHKRIVETIHASGRPAILHSCGYAEEIMMDIAGDMCYDGKHSFEDTIMPVEKAYMKWGRQIAILGGIDLDFICRSSAEAIHQRAKFMLELAAGNGGYALGTGNSVPEYIEDEKYFALISAATGQLY
jgi:uroporphyrinogen decarboxylase